MNYLSLLPCLLFTLILQAQPDVKDWYFQMPGTYNGISVDRLYHELGDKKPAKKVVVAVLDSGVDISHEDLVNQIWVNTDEIPDNGIDDDKNGYVDDIHGWNFLGNKSGKNITKETLEVTRLYAYYRNYFKNKDLKKLSKKDTELYKDFLEYERIVTSHRQEAESFVANVEGNEQIIRSALDAFDTQYPDQELTPEFIESFDPGDDELLQIAGQIFDNSTKLGLSFEDTKSIMDFIHDSYEEQLSSSREELEYRYNPDYRSREIIGDDYNNTRETGYGNPDVRGGFAFHGTHVSGIIGAEWNDIGMRGIARDVVIMPVRVVPNGDEHDKDVANAIRYAVDNGASVINMSFGKGYSWDKKTVDKAVKYARKHDVLLVHGAGNDASDNDEMGNFPNADYEKSGLFGKKQADNWIEVGALNSDPGQRSIAPFSNYGKETVDLFAPGMYIYSAAPENQYQNAQGTSMASPVVAGVAAVIRGYFPDLKACEVRDVILSSVSPIEGKVHRPGDYKLVEASEISRSGGFVDVYSAYQAAARQSSRSGGKHKSNGIQDTAPDAKPGRA